MPAVEPTVEVTRYRKIRVLLDPDLASVRLIGRAIGLSKRQVRLRFRMCLVLHDPTPSDPPRSASSQHGHGAENDSIRVFMKISFSFFALLMKSKISCVTFSASSGSCRVSSFICSLSRIASMAEAKFSVEELAKPIPFSVFFVNCS